MPEVYSKGSLEQRLDEEYVYVGRPSKWGNPFRLGLDGTREEVIEKFRQYVFTSGLIDEVHELAGKNLVCWCAPLACHADVLLELANQGRPE